MEESKRRITSAISSFCDTEDHLGCLDGATKPQSAVQRVNQLVSEARRRVPAYAKCHDEFGTKPAPGEEYQSAVTLTKKNYLCNYPLPERCWDGVFDISFIHFSSGSTGTPTLWPRTIQSELDVALTFERVMRDAFEAHTQPTLCVVAFPLGAWVGGMFTTMCLHHLTTKGFPLTIITPGNKPPEILSILSTLEPQNLFAQTVIFGYPPFVKGVIDAAAATGMDWAPLNVGLVLAGECYTESWRQLVSERACIRQPARRIVSLYGTADAGVIAAETELCAKIRHFLAAHPAARKHLLQSERLPTLCQYDPHGRFIDTHGEDGTLIVTCVPHMPLDAGSEPVECLNFTKCFVGAPTIKYAIGDAGGIMDYHAMCEWLKGQGMQLEGIDSVRRTLPFVWVFGRTFWCVSLYGANVFVENVMGAVAAPQVASLVTGKFVLEVEEDQEADKRVLVHVEVAKGTSPTDEIRGALEDTITQELLHQNSEYANYVPSDAQRVHVLLYDFGDPDWFPVGVKHKYTRAQ